MDTSGRNFYPMESMMKPVALKKAPIPGSIKLQAIISGTGMIQVLQQMEILKGMIRFIMEDTSFIGNRKNRKQAINRNLLNSFYGKDRNPRRFLPDQV